jgi:formylglycine-generating enzyme required for sulfatase activity
MTDSNDFSDLLISLFRKSNDQYNVELRFDQVHAQTEHVPKRAIVLFDDPVLQELRQTTLNPEKHGRILRQVLFEKPGLMSAIQQYVAKADQKLRLRIEIDPSAAQLADIRWEMLRNLADTDFLAIDANLPFSRFLTTSDWDDYDLRPPEALHALIAVANPRNLSQIEGYSVSGPVGRFDYRLIEVDVQGEVERARAALAGLDQHNVFLLDGTPGSQGQATYQQIIAQLEKPCDILYLVCHGILLNDRPDQPPKPYLLLEKEDRAADWVNGENLASYIHNLPVQQRPRLVVLASCKSGGQSRVPSAQKSPKATDGNEFNGVPSAMLALGPCLVEAGLPAVVAMQDDIQMETVKQFMPVFFRSLLGKTGGRVDQAMAAARNAIYATHCPDWWVPVLYLRLKDGRIFNSFARELPSGVQTGETGLIEIPDGWFKMGPVPGPDVPNSQSSLHSVFLPAYLISKYPVTCREYARFINAAHRPVPLEMGWDGQNPPKGQEDYPVRGVTWFEALEYCHWLQDMTGKNYCLPSEAQWERSARGQDARLYPWGDEWLPGRCNLGNQNTAAVGAFPEQNETGLCDLVGNVLQWTTTIWGEKRSQPDPVYNDPWKADGRDDLQANRQLRRVVRGSSFSDSPQDCACTTRRSFLPDDRGQPGKRHGFRVVINNQLSWNQRR